MVTDIYNEFLAASGRSERDGQREAVRLLCELSDAEEVDAYAIQAPTGTGKSYAALLAGVHNFYKGRRTIIGTSTVVLSDQYAGDIKVVSAAFPDVNFCVLKGASNYYCGNKAGFELSRAKGVRKKNLMDTLLMYRQGRLDYNPSWACSDTENCLDCADRFRRTGETVCEYSRARAAALQADVVVTTHAMINVDARMRATALASGSEAKSHILGNIWLTVFDEAHKASASLIYDESFSLKSLESLERNGLFGSIPYTRRDAFRDHFATVTESDWYTPTPTLASGVLETWLTPVELRSMYKELSRVAEKDQPAMRGLLGFLGRTRVVLEEIASGDCSGGTALWAVGHQHKDGSYTRKYKLKEMTPEPLLVKTMQSQRTAWLSATIGTETHPTYSLQKCGMRPRFFPLNSPFDYSRQLSWTVRTEEQVSNQGEFISKINNHWGGGCVVLTPYHKRKESIASGVRMADRGILVQEQTGNTTSNNAMVAGHIGVAEAGGSPVLVGVEIFSTGIDLPGDQLTKLVIADLFPIREDWAFISWRGRWIEEVGGGDAFRDYVLPERAITLEQQIGRVVRRETDVGVVVFYLGVRDWKPGSQGQQIIEEALLRFPGARRIE